MSVDGFLSCMPLSFTAFLDNHVYGFDPHDDSDYLTISGNTCYNNGEAGRQSIA